MKLALTGAAVHAAAAIGFSAGPSEKTTAVAADPHAERIAKSPRHTEWVAIKVNALDRG